MMHKSLTLIASTTLALFTHLSFAATLDAATIKSVHDETVKAFYAKCMKDFQGATDAICNCLASKAEKALDDNALNLCANDQTGTDCITKAVATAATSATTQTSISECTAATVPTPPPATPTVGPATMETPVPAPSTSTSAPASTTAATSSVSSTTTPTGR